MNLVPAGHGDCPALQSLVAQATLMAYLGEADAILALALPGPGLAMPPVVALASAEQREQFLRRFESDAPRWGAFAITEPTVVPTRLPCAPAQERPVVAGS
jgi:acyl-CoA dehydrogenase